MRARTRARLLVRSCAPAPPLASRFDCNTDTLAYRRCRRPPPPFTPSRLPQGTNEDIEPEPSSTEGGGDEELSPGERPVIAKAVVWMVNPFSRRDGEQKPPFARIFEKFSK